MDTFFEGWKASGNAVFYRPVPPTAAEFSSNGKREHQGQVGRSVKQYNSLAH